MQDAAQERDSLKEKVQRLTSELEAVQSRLQEASHSNIKKECSHQASQTEVTEREKDYKSLFEKAKQKVNELIKDKEALIAATETKPNHSTGQGEEGDVDEIALQVDSLIRRLDQSNKENNDLLLELRQNVGRLLITYVPALDLEQVNFRCNVIDEILEQVLASRDSVTGEGLSDDAINE
uniref:Uncharacterized protein n=1 Tax=Acanthochromis polyacanthus TaxID=80966 RepID=A0A3Q1GYS0_9TELE